MQYNDEIKSKTNIPLSTHWTHNSEKVAWRHHFITNKNNMLTLGWHLSVEICYDVISMLGACWVIFI